LKRAINSLNINSNYFVQMVLIQFGKNGGKMHSLDCKSRPQFLILIYKKNI